MTGRDGSAVGGGGFMSLPLRSPPSFLSLGVIAAMCLPAQLMAQPLSGTRGFQVGINGQAGVIASTGEPSEHGWGGGLDLAYGLSDGVSLWFSWSVIGVARKADQLTPSYEVTQADLGVRVTVLSDDRRWRPFAEAGWGGVYETSGFVGNTPPVSREGLAWTIGAGLDRFLTPRWIVETRVLRASGSYDEVRTRGARPGRDVRSSRFQVGIRRRLVGTAGPTSEARPYAALQARGNER